MRCGVDLKKGKGYYSREEGTAIKKYIYQNIILYLQEHLKVGTKALSWAMAARGSVVLVKFLALFL